MRIWPFGKKDKKEVKIEIKKKKKDDELRLSGLECYHVECYDGRVGIEIVSVLGATWGGIVGYGWGSKIKFLCERCKFCAEIPFSKEARLNIFKTAIDGEERRFTDKTGKIEIILRQKVENSEENEK